MAVVIVKSTGITNRDASPRVIDNPGAWQGSMRGFAGQVTVTSGDSIGSTYILGKVPSNAVLHSLRLTSDDMGTTTTAKFGVYDTTANGGAAVSAALFAATKVLNAGALVSVDILHDALGSNPVTNAEKRLWEILGLSVDPVKDYDIVATLDGACDGTGNMALKCTYAI